MFWFNSMNDWAWEWCVICERVDSLNRTLRVELQSKIRFPEAINYVKKEKSQHYFFQIRKEFARSMTILGAERVDFYWWTETIELIHSEEPAFRITML